MTFSFFKKSSLFLWQHCAPSPLLYIFDPNTNRVNVWSIILIIRKNHSKVFVKTPEQKWLWISSTKLLNLLFITQLFMLPNYRLKSQKPFLYQPSILEKSFDPCKLSKNYFCRIKRHTNMHIQVIKGDRANFFFRLFAFLHFMHWGT